MAAPETTYQIPDLRRRFERQMADYQERLADRITRVREQAGYDLEPFALKADISPKQLRRLEAGEIGAPRRATLRKIALAAGVPYSEVAIDLDAEDALLQERLDEINEKLDEILRRLDRGDEGGPAAPERLPEPKGPPPDVPSSDEPETDAEAS